MSGLYGFGILLLALMLFLGFLVLRRKAAPILRDIPAFARLARTMGVSVEEGSRLHVSLGRGDVLTPPGSSSYAGLALLRVLVEQTSGSDKPLVVTSGDGLLSLLSQGTVRAGYRSAGAQGSEKRTASRLTGLSPFSYAAGVIPDLSDEKASACVMLGHYGPEVGLLVDAVDRANALAVFASDELSAQSLLYASQEEPLIGEELYAAGAYAGAGTPHQASLQVQDVLRWVVILVLLVGSVIRLIGSF